jgi:hypothetical protein
VIGGLQSEPGEAASNRGPRSGLLCAEAGTSIALGFAIALRHHRVGNQSVPVLHQHMAQIRHSAMEFCEARLYEVNKVVECIREEACLESEAEDEGGREAGKNKK